MGSSKYSGWNTKPKLDEARVLEPDAPPHRSRKNTRRWCKGKPGREHQLELIRHRWLSRERTCGYMLGGADWWVCSHVYKCSACSKLVKWLGEDNCPDRPREDA